MQYTPLLEKVGLQQAAVNSSDYIIEINDSPSGFLGKNELEDMSHVRDLVLEKLAKEYPEYAKTDQEEKDNKPTAKAANTETGTKEKERKDSKK